MSTHHRQAEFVSLHEKAAALLDNLAAHFDVERIDKLGLDTVLENQCNPARPSTMLLPRDRSAAPLVIVFSDFPGLLVRFGRWSTEAFPACGCEACGETVEGEIERLSSRVEDLVAGRFRELLRRTDEGAVSLASEFWSTTSRSRLESVIEPDLARRLLESTDQPYHDWAPWRRKE